MPWPGVLTDIHGSFEMPGLTDVSNLRSCQRSYRRSSMMTLLEGQLAAA